MSKNYGTLLKNYLDTKENGTRRMLKKDIKAHLGWSDAVYLNKLSRTPITPPERMAISQLLGEDIFTETPKS